MSSLRNLLIKVPATLILVLVNGLIPIHAQTFSVRYPFGSHAGDPFAPLSPSVIAQGRDGNVYSTSPSGGKFSNGTVFKFTPQGTLTVIYDFDGTVGGEPFSGLTLGTDGDFYGSTKLGGSGRYGAVFKVAVDGTLTVCTASC